MRKGSQTTGGAAGGAAATESLEERRARFERATTPHLDTLFRVAVRMTGAADRAEDAVQETVLRAWRYFDTFDPSREVKVWLLAILRNAVYEAARQRKREVKAASIDEAGGGDVVSAPIRKTDPGARLAEREVLDAVEKLPEDYRMVAMLAIVEELKYREIAEALEIPIGTVMSRLFRARQLLRYHLKGFVGDAEPIQEVA